MLCWQRREGKSVLSTLDSSAIKKYYVRMTKPREGRQRETVSVFDARKAITHKLPKAFDTGQEHAQQSSPTPQQDEGEQPPQLCGFWKFRAVRDGVPRLAHPLASAEIETNAPYQPFHSDHKVTISLIADSSRANRLTNSSASFFLPNPTQREVASADSDEKWVFGGEIQTRRSSATLPSQPLEEGNSVIYRETKFTSDVSNLNATPTEVLEEGIGHIVSNTKKRKAKKGRMHTQLAEVDDLGDTGLDFSRHDAAFNPDFDLLESEDRV
jgi:hypothetical protein